MKSKRRCFGSGMWAYQYGVKHLDREHARCPFCLRSVRLTAVNELRVHVNYQIPRDGDAPTKAEEGSGNGAV